MSQEQQDAPEDDASSAANGGVQQQQQQAQSEGHAGHGSESILKQLREWESHRAGHSGGRRRPGPN